VFVVADPMMKAIDERATMSTAAPPTADAVLTQRLRLLTHAIQAAPLAVRGEGLVGVERFHPRVILARFVNGGRGEQREG
jgi:hypothetical protein